MQWGGVDVWGMSCGVVPSRHVVLVVLIRGLRPRLPSLRSVVPSRHAFSLYLFAHELHECNEGTGVLQNAPTRHLTPKSIKAFILLWIEAAFTQNFTPKNYTYPSLEGITG